MKVQYDEGLTSHIGPESCAGAREGAREALTGEHVSQAIERRKSALRDADALATAEGNTTAVHIGEDRGDPRRRRTWRVCKSSTREPGGLRLRPQQSCCGPHREATS